MGDQSCSFAGVGLYDKHMCSSTILPNNSTMILRVTFRNNSVEEGALIVLGYSLRNNRGIDIASNNSEIEKVGIKCPPPGDVCTVRMSIGLPELHPGSYSLSVSLGHRDNEERMHSLDGITNAVVFDIVSERPVHVLMSLKTEYEVELADE
jgi:lipopolysaccharide transport system ATP-binding protein